MAGAGKRTFIAGEVLTAAQVNDYLMDQAVMRFSGSAARAASITAPTEGMVTYLDDANRLEIYDGSAWQQVPTDQDDLRNVVTASGQILVGAANASVIAVGGATEGQVLTAASAQPGGVQWVTPSGAGDAVFKNVAATGVTALPSTLGAGFYRISTGNTTSWSQTQFRFVDAEGLFYGVTITSGVGFATIPVPVASVNITTSAGFNLLAEEIPGVTATLPPAPTVTDFGWQTLTNASIAFTTSETPSQVGYFVPDTGQFISTSVITSPLSAPNITASTRSFGSEMKFVMLQRDSDGLWSTAASVYSASVLDTPYPFQVFTGNGTYTPPSWSTTADVFIVSGGGAGGGAANDGNCGGGGGAGGASLYTGVSTPSPVSVTIGAGGSSGGTGRGGSGTASSFGALATTGGGGGGAGSPNQTGLSGGSGGGGGTNGTGGAGTSGQGFAGGNANGPTQGGGGGGSTEVGNTNGQSFGGDGTTQWGYAHGGGGGGGYAPITSRAGGFGGGGAGQAGGNGEPGVVNTGGGGGGCTGNYFTPTARSGGAGGSGVVIVRAK